MDPCLARLALDALSAHIAIVDATGTIVAVNHAWRAFAEANHGAARSVCEGVNYLAACDSARGPDAELAATFARGMRSVLGGELATYALEYPCHSPEIRRWFVGRITRLVTHGHVHLVISHEDISDRRAAEDAVRAEEERFRAIADYTADLECWFGPDGRLLWVNPAAERIVGYSVDECMAMPGFPLPLLAPEDSDAERASFASALQRSSGDDREFRFLRKDGVVRWGSVSWRPIFSRDGTHLGHRSSVRDISARKQMEADLRQSEECHHALVASSLDAVMLTTTDGGILDANGAACRMFGRSREDLIAFGRKGIVDPADPRWAQAIEERARTGRFRGELTLVRADGSRFPGEISSAVFLDRNGEVRTSTVIRDISEWRRIEDELRASREQLRSLATRVQAAREEERTAVAREIHDVLAQDLTRLKIDLVGMQRRLERHPGPVDAAVFAPRLTEMARIADAAIESVQRIATELRPAALDGLGLCAAVEWQVRDFRERTGIGGHTRAPQEEPPLERDSATALFRILQESLLNVHRHAQATRVDVDLRQESTEIVLVVRDDGCGIEPEVLHNPFSIGLAGMRERALVLGGRLEIRSEPGRGTTVEVRLESRRVPGPDTPPP